MLDLYCKWYDFFLNYDQKQYQERVQAATEQNQQTKLNINQKIKKKRLKKTRNNNFLMINNKLILYKNEAKGFWNYLRNKNKIKRCEDEERNWFWTFGVRNTWNREKCCDK